MTNAAKTVRVKTSSRMPKRIPACKHGSKLAVILEQGKEERYPLLNDEQFEQELRERRGRNF